MDWARAIIAPLHPPTPTHTPTPNTHPHPHTHTHPQHTQTDVYGFPLCMGVWWIDFLSEVKSFKRKRSNPITSVHIYMFSCSITRDYSDGTLYLANSFSLNTTLIFARIRNLLQLLGDRRHISVKYNVLSTSLN